MDNPSNWVELKKTMVRFLTMNNYFNFVYFEKIEIFAEKFLEKFFASSYINWNAMPTFFINYLIAKKNQAVLAYVIIT